jgi:long-chain acyl-CoA synthetase
VSGNAAQLLVETAGRFGDRPALSVGGETWTYSDLEDASRRVAGLLKSKGLRPGDRVGLMLPNVPEFPAIYYGIWRAGGSIVPMNILLQERETTFYLEDSQARWLFVWHEYAAPAARGARVAGAEVVQVQPESFRELLGTAEPLAEVMPRAGDDTAVILYTSGTTGRPKGAMLTHDTMRIGADRVTPAILGAGEKDVILGALPLFHSFGQTVSLNGCIRAGACLVMIPRFTPRTVLEAVQRDGVTIFLGVPTMYHALLNFPERDAYDTSSLRICVSGGASLPSEVLFGFEQAFGCTVIEGYGLSETAATGTLGRPDRPRRPGSIGPVIEGVEVRLVDDHGKDVPAGAIGELVMRGFNLMKGYWDLPGATAEAIRDGWFHTGDLARVDEEGNYYIVDRKKDLIIRGGYNVYPREIEDVLYEHPAVLEAAVVGVADPALGEEVAAVVVLKDGATADAAEIQSFVKERLAAYKYPRVIQFTDALPVGPTGKILKREIRISAPTSDSARGSSTSRSTTSATERA